MVVVLDKNDKSIAGISFRDGLGEGCLPKNDVSLLKGSGPA